MNVLYLTDVAYPWTKGGSELRIARLAEYLTRRGDSVKIICGRWWAGSRDPPGVIGVPLISQVYDRRRSIPSAISFTLSAAKALGNLAENFDIVEFNQSPFLHFSLIDLLGRSRPLREARIVGMLHEAWQEYWLRYSLLGGLVGYGLERRAMDSLDYIITISEFTKRRFLRWPVSQSKIGVIHPGVDFAAISEVAPSTDSSDLIFVGRLVEDAHVERLVEAVRLLHVHHGIEVRATVVGGGPMFGPLRRLASSLGVSEAIRFAGPLENHASVYSLLKSSRLFLLPSAPHGGWNIASMEANAAGLPVVTPSRSEIGFAGELVDPGHSGLIVDDESPESLASAVHDLLVDESARSRMGGEAADRAKRFEWDAVCEQTASVYESVISRQA